jgi:hypothetical protein
MAAGPGRSPRLTKGAAARLRVGRRLSAGIPLNLVQKWLGRAQLTTTAIYADAVGEEEQSIAARMWWGSQSEFSRKRQSERVLPVTLLHSQAVVLLSPPGADNAAGIAGLPTSRRGIPGCTESRSVAVERAQGNVGARGTNWPSFPVVLGGSSADECRSAPPRF